MRHTKSVSRVRLAQATDPPQPLFPLIFGNRFFRYTKPVDFLFGIQPPKGRM